VTIAINGLLTPPEALYTTYTYRYHVFSTPGTVATQLPKVVRAVVLLALPDIRREAEQASIARPAPLSQGVRQVSGRRGGLGGRPTRLAVALAAHEGHGQRGGEGVVGRHRIRRPRLLEREDGIPAVPDQDVAAGADGQADQRRSPRQ